jgi:hypothetical protein
MWLKNPNCTFCDPQGSAHQKSSALCPCGSQAVLVIRKVDGRRFWLTNWGTGYVLRSGEAGDVGQKIDGDVLLEQFATGKQCNRCHRPMIGMTAYDGACACGGLIEAVRVIQS